MENRDKPAYPVTLDWSETDKKVFTTTEKPGLSKREMFAMAAMQGILSGRNEVVERRDYPVEQVALWAMQQADELLKQLESKPI